MSLFQKLRDRDRFQKGWSDAARAAALAVRRQADQRTELEMGARAREVQGGADEATHAAQSEYHRTRMTEARERGNIDAADAHEMAMDYHGAASFYLGEKNPEVREASPQAWELSRMIRNKENR